MPTPEEIEHERDHLRSLAAQAKAEMADAASGNEPEPVEEQQALMDEARRRIEELDVEDHGYDIPPPPDPEAVDEDGNDNRASVPTAFLVYVDPGSGRAIATTEIDKVLGLIKIEREADLPDFARYGVEIAEDSRLAMTAQTIINGTVQAQMQMAAKMQEQMQSAQVAANLGDLRNIRNRR
jgi:hypothetical protein